MVRCAIVLAGLSLMGCKDSQVPAPKGAEAPRAVTASKSQQDIPGPRPAAPVVTDNPASPTNPIAASSASKTAPIPAAVPSNARVTAAGLSFEPPEGWIQQAPRSRMRLAQFQLPSVAGDPRPGMLTVIAAGGDIDANIKRWQGQFQNSPAPKRTTEMVDNIQVIRVEFGGAFLFKARPMAPGPGTPQPGTLLLGAIVKTAQAQLFFKAWGPKNTMEKWRSSFDAMVRSFAKTN